jgi:predicted O-methyltransferase YrrM
MSNEMQIIEQIPGWLSPEAIDLTQRLFEFQAARRIEGAILELGVFKGKYLTLLAALSKDEETPIVGVDAFFERLGVLLDEKWTKAVISDILRNIERAGADPTRVDIIPSLTADLQPERLKVAAPNGFRFISVDAGHQAEDLVADLTLIQDLLSDGAIIAIDDVFNSVVPGVAEGVCRYFENGAKERLASFATCGNKLFVSSSEWHSRYFTYCREIVLSQNTHAYLEVARRRQVENDKNLFVPKFFGFPVVVF